MTNSGKMRGIVFPLTLVVICGCAISLLGFGPRSIMGLYMVPMTETYGWTREAFAFSLAIQNIMWGIGQPFAGAIADRYGTARVLTAGGLLYALALALMSWAPSTFWLDITTGVMMGLAVAAASFSIVLAALGRRVPPEKRSIIFGIGTAAGSMGQFVFAPIGRTLIREVGWQESLLWLAAMMLIIPVLSIVLRGRSDQSISAEAVTEATLTQTVRQAFRHRSYVLLVAGFFVCGFHVAFITAHLPAYIEDLGLDPLLGAWALALIGLFNVIGSIASGIIGQKYSKPYFLALIYLARSVVIALFLLLPPSATTILVFAGAMGLLWLSTVPPTSSLVAIMFGSRYMATLMGIVFFNHQVGSFLGVWLGGWLYDKTGSYDIVWYLGIVLGIAAAFIHWPIREAPAEVRAVPAE